MKFRRFARVIVEILHVIFVPLIFLLEDIFLVMIQKYLIKSEFDITSLLHHIRHKRE